MGNVTRLDDNHPVQKLATRQLAMKDRKFHSWFIYVEDIYKYGLEMRNTNAFPWPNLAWKTHVHTVVIAFWKKQLLEQASSMSFLAHLVLYEEGTNKIWSVCKGKSHLVEAATIRARMVTGKYTLQATRTRYNQHCRSHMPFLW